MVYFHIVIVYMTSYLFVQQQFIWSILRSACSSLPRIASFVSMDNLFLYISFFLLFLAWIIF